MNDVTIIITGTLLTLLMSVNAFFLKDILNNLQTVKIELAKLLTDHSHSKILVDSNARDIRDIRDRLHSLEGQEKNILQFIEEYRK